eukprot:UC4_evm1s623
MTSKTKRAILEKRLQELTRRKEKKIKKQKRFDGAVNSGDADFAGCASAEELGISEEERIQLGLESYEARVTRSKSSQETVDELIYRTPLSPIISKSFDKNASENDIRSCKYHQREIKLKESQKNEAHKRKVKTMSRSVDDEKQLGSKISNLGTKNDDASSHRRNSIDSMVSPPTFPKVQKIDYHSDECCLNDTQASDDSYSVKHDLSQCDLFSNLQYSNNPDEINYSRAQQVPTTNTSPKEKLVENLGSVTNISIGKSKTLKYIGCVKGSQCIREVHVTNLDGEGVVVWCTDKEVVLWTSNDAHNRRNGKILFRLSENATNETIISVYHIALTRFILIGGKFTRGFLKICSMTDQSWFDLKNPAVSKPSDHLSFNGMAILSQNLISASFNDVASSIQLTVYEMSESFETQIICFSLPCCSSLSPLTSLVSVNNDSSKVIGTTFNRIICWDVKSNLLLNIVNLSCELCKNVTIRCLHAEFRGVELGQVDDRVFLILNFQKTDVHDKDEEQLDSLFPDYDSDSCQFIVLVLPR